MKYLSVIFSLCAFLVFSCELEAQHNHNHDHATEKTTKSKVKADKKEVFKVYGNCGMCKDRIETALSEVEGLASADWDSGTKKISVSYDSKVVSLDKIKKAIAKVGHDTDKFRAKDEVYNNLHGCCQYDRPEN